MKLSSSLFAAIIAISGLSFSASAANDSDIKKKIIEASIKEYRGKCPCPYTVMKNGKTCDQMSSYSKNAKKSDTRNSAKSSSKKKAKQIVCYEKDVTDEMIKNFKQ